MFTTLTGKVKQLTNDVDISGIKDACADFKDAHLPRMHEWFKGKMDVLTPDEHVMAKLTHTVKHCTDDVNLAVVKDKYEEVIEAYLPAVQMWLKDTVGTLTRDMVHNDALMIHALRVVYELLPYAIRLLVREETFIAMCLRHRDNLIEKYDVEPPLLFLEQIPPEEPLTPLPSSELSA